MNKKNDIVIPCSPSPEPCGSQGIYQRWMQHCLKLAKHPGWKEQIWWTVKDLDADESGLFTGFKEDFLRRINDDASIHPADHTSPKRQTSVKPIRNLHADKNKKI
jgi:hypothetical protein